jgi:4-alpha-glucanotransferase
MYLSLRELSGVDEKIIAHALDELKKIYNKKSKCVNYSIKNDKLELLWKIYQNDEEVMPSEMKIFVEQNKHWIKNYALYKVLSSLDIRLKMSHSPNFLKELDEKEISNIETKHYKRINFYYWVQWQLYEQFKKIKEYANRNGVLLMGDLPFLVSRISSDVWSHPEYFNLHESAGAPPDMYFAQGQKWGTPPYNWANIEKDRYSYIEERLKYAENFYNMYRIDHFIGLFRLWTIPEGNDPAGAAINGKFIPENKELWEEHGKKIIKVFLRSTSMLPCAEDLGTVPACSYRTLKEYGIPGIEFQRFLKDPANNYQFREPDRYRKNSAAVISTHDSTFFISWWKHEAGTLDKIFFKMLCSKHNIKGKLYQNIIKRLFDKNLSKHGRYFCKKEIGSVNKLLEITGLKREEAIEIIEAYNSFFGEKNKYLHYLGINSVKRRLEIGGILKRNMERISESASIFSIQLIQDYLSLDRKLLKYIDRWSYRINKPGTFSKKNWSNKLPIKLEDLGKLEINKIILEINQKTERIV